MHSMGSNLSLRLWYGYIIVFMDAIAYCLVNAYGSLGMVVMMWFELVDGVSNTLMIQY
jgi:hypothetical protein